MFDVGKGERLAFCFKTKFVVEVSGIKLSVYVNFVYLFLFGVIDCKFDQLGSQVFPSRLFKNSDTFKFYFIVYLSYSGTTDSFVFIVKDDMFRDVI